VLGSVAGVDGGYGVTGLVPAVEVRFFPEWTVQEGFRRATAIAKAIDAVHTGDIVLLEMQTIMFGGDYGPAELDPVVWLLTRAATDAGILVVGAAGNGSQNLDASEYEAYRSRGDSGAILVGAGSPNTQHTRLSFSTYGSRINLQGWGASVFSAGYGSYAMHGGDENQAYTSSFGGTSAATPLVAAACAAIQSLADSRCRPRLLPIEMRAILVDTGVPQGAAGTGHIGPLPNVLAAAQSLGLNLPPDCPCPADVDHDGLVGATDIVAVIAAWGPCPVGSECPQDLDENGQVNMLDLVAVLNAWGACP
jgi:hypothetical protein